MHSQERRLSNERWSVGIHLTADHHIGESNWLTEGFVPGLGNIRPTAILLSSTFLANYQMAQNFTISSGVGVSGKDLIGVFICPVCDHWGPHFPERVNLRFLEIPIQFSYAIGKRDLKGFLLAGIVGSYLVNKPYRYLKPARSSMISFQTGAGIIKQFDDRVRLNLNLVYKRSITKIFENADINFQTLGLMIGLVYGFP